MAQTCFFFYDLETSGFNPRHDRIMQFAGRRTTLELEPMGEPVNWLVKLSPDVLPSPGAVLLTGITPQQTVREGISEAELARRLMNEVFTPGTIAVGFNNIRFDDEFIRNLFYRDFYDAYEWAWADGRSRWDLLDAVRFTRALRPEGLVWPTGEDEQPTNRLEHLASANGLMHEQAHDALSDVDALIGLTRLIRTSQPKLFSYLLNLRAKQEVNKVVDLATPQPFVYASGRYPKEFHHTTIAYPIGEGSRPGSVIVYDLRHNPADYAGLGEDDLRKLRWANREERTAPGFKPLPVKELAYNKCPAIAPIGVLDAASETRIGLTAAQAQKHLDALHTSGLVPKLYAAMASKEAYPKAGDVDEALYDGFIGGGDKTELASIQAADATKLASLKPNFNDQRLPELFVRYKARNFPEALQDGELAAWEAYRLQRLEADWPKFTAELEQRAAHATKREGGIIGDLQLWAESIAPSGQEDIA